MSEPRVKVGLMSTFSRAEEGPSPIIGEPGETAPAATLEFNDGETFLISPSDRRYAAWAGLLDRWPRHNLPLYVEAEPETGVVKRIVAPKVKQVAAVAPEPEGERLKVVPFATPIFYYLSTSHPRFDELRALLLEARETGAEVVVFLDPASELNDDRILDVAPLPAAAEPPASDATSNGPVVALVEVEMTLLLFDVTADFTRPFVTESEARALFQDLRDNHEIPFCFVKDCCKSRAHRMCQIIAEEGIPVSKIWNYGSGTLASADEAQWRRTLSVTTPEGDIRWLLHVAPVIDVVLDDGEVVRRVMDPALFGEPVSVRRWVARQSDSNSRVRIRDARFFWYSPHNVPGASGPLTEFVEGELDAHWFECVT